MHASREGEKKKHAFLGGPAMSVYGGLTSKRAVTSKKKMCASTVRRYSLGTAGRAEKKNACCRR